MTHVRDCDLAGSNTPDRRRWRAACASRPTAASGRPVGLGAVTVLTAPGFDPGHVAGGEQVEPGVFNWPHVALAPQVRAFIACLHGTQIVADADWVTWLEHGGRALYEYPDQLDRATLEQCRMLLIAHVRRDRFVDGHLLSVLRDGHLVHVSHRIGELVEATD